MTLGVALLGANSIRHIRQDPKKLPEFALVLRHCRTSVRDARTLLVKEVPASLAGVRELGMASHLHMLRGVAILAETTNAIDMSLTEDDLRAASIVFYAGDVHKSRFAHLIHHHEANGFFAPLDGFSPRSVNRAVQGQHSSGYISIGSSHALLRELDELNAIIALPGDPGQLGDEKFARRAQAHRWPHVAMLWGLLRLYARESIAASAFIQLSTSSAASGERGNQRGTSAGQPPQFRSSLSGSVSTDELTSERDSLTSLWQVEGLEFELTDIDDARRILDTESLSQFDMAAVTDPEDWKKLRRPRVATDRALTGQAIDWLMSLPPTLRPENLSLEFPRVTNALAGVWHEPEQCQLVLDGLLCDKREGREGRQGFPAAVHQELVALRNWTQLF
jgi:hypothetical protein